MSEPNNLVDHYLQQVVGNPQPTNEDRAYAHHKLAQEIGVAVDSGEVSRRSVLWRRVAIASVLTVVVSVVTVTQVVKPAPATAALLELAAIAEVTDPLSVPDQAYAYTTSHSQVLGVIPPEALLDRTTPLAYLISQTREIWIGTDGASQIVTTAGIPTFFDPDDETDYYLSGIDQFDTIGETVTQTFIGDPPDQPATPWPTDSMELKEALIADLISSNQPVSDATIVDAGLNLLIETGASPDLRRAVFELFATLDDLELVEYDLDGSATFQIERSEYGPERTTFTIDDSSHLVLREVLDLDGDPALGIAPETVTSTQTYNRTIIVTSLDRP